MAGYVAIGALAAFGLICVVWFLCGWVLPKSGGVLIYAGGDRIIAAQRYLWLKEMGFVRCSLLIVDPKRDEEEWLQAQGIAICSREELKTRLEMGAEPN